MKNEKLSNVPLLSLALFASVAALGSSISRFDCRPEVKVRPDDPARLVFDIEESKQSLTYTAYDSAGNILTSDSNRGPACLRQGTSVLEARGYHVVAEVTGEIPGNCPSRNCGLFVPYHHSIELAFRPIAYEGRIVQELYDLLIDERSQLKQSFVCRLELEVTGSAASSW